MSTPRRLIPVVLVLLVACGGNNRKNGDADDDGDVVDEDAGAEVLPDTTPDGEDDPTVDGEDPVPDTTPDGTPDAIPDAEDDDAGSEDPADDDAGSTDAADDDAGGADASDATGDGSSVMCVDRVTDGRFQTTTSWTTVGSTAINTTAPGHLDAGEGEIPPAATCDLDTISQSFTLPSQTDCGAARLDVSLNVMTSMGGMGTAFGIEVNDNYHHTSAGFISSWTVIANCLGEAAHTGTMTVSLGAAYPPTECDSSPSFAQGLRVDNARIEYDSGCPLIGLAVNGDLEDGSGFGWETSSLLGGVAEADASGVGISGSYGAHLHIDAGCQQASMSVPVSIPTTSTMNDPTLSFQANLSSGETADLVIGDVPAIALEGASAWGERRVCLPHHLAGAVYDVQWSAQYWGACGVAAGPLDLYVDNVVLVDDAACIFASGMLDPGFEASRADDKRFGWILQENAGSWGGTVIAEVASDATSARSGSGVAHLSVDQRCDSATLKQSIEIPAPTSTEGPAVKLWYRYPSPSVSVLQATVYPFREWSGRRIADAVLSGTPTYTQQTLCLPPELAGRPAVIVVNLNSSGLCADYFTAAEEAWLDDFEVTTDSTCPTS